MTLHAGLCCLNTLIQDVPFSGSSAHWQCFYFINNSRVNCDTRNRETPWGPSQPSVCCPVRWLVPKLEPRANCCVNTSISPNIVPKTFYNLKWDFTWPIRESFRLPGQSRMGRSPQCNSSHTATESQTCGGELIPNSVCSSLSDIKVAEITRSDGGVWSKRKQTLYHRPAKTKSSFAS